MNKTKNFNIEVLRGIAIIFVLICHAFFWGNLGFRNQLAYEQGVDLFFVISGFLMGATYLSKININQFSFPSAYNFYIKRFTRLYPAMLFWSILTLCTAHFWVRLGILPSKQDFLQQTISNLVFMGNFYNYSHENAFGYWWSIGLEGQFYFILPILLYLSGKYFWRVVTVLVLVLGLSAIWSFDKSAWMFRMHGLFIGLLCWKISSLQAFSEIKSKINSLSSLYINGIILFLLLSVLILPRAINQAFPFVSLVDCILLGIGLLLAICYKDKLFGKAGHIFVFFGRIAYSMYLSHLLIFHSCNHLMNKYNLNGGGYKLAIIVLTIIIAWLSYKFIESRMKKENYMI